MKLRFFFLYEKPLARPVVQRKPTGENEGIKTPFAIIEVRSANCTKIAKGGHSIWD